MTTGATVTDRVALVERTASGGDMPPLHVRDEEETYRVLEGVVTFFVDDYAVEARPGDLVVALAGVPRAFRVESASARWLVLTRVGSLARYEDFGRAVAPPSDGGWPSDDELASVAAIGAPNGIDVLGPPGALP